jgi:hypothetical protein
MMEINFVVPGTTNPATVSKFGARFIGPSSSATVHFYNSAGQLIMTKTPTVVASASGGEDSWGAADIAKITIEGSSYAVEDVRFDTPVVIGAPTSANEATFTCDSELVQFWTVNTTCIEIKIPVVLCSWISSQFPCACTCTYTTHFFHSLLLPRQTNQNRCLV